MWIHRRMDHDILNLKPFEDLAARKLVLCSLPTPPEKDIVELRTPAMQGLETFHGPNRTCSCGSLNFNADNAAIEGHHLHYKQSSKCRTS